MAVSESPPERLAVQAALLEPVTGRLLRAAGIGPGARVLDAGSGAGDVTFLIGAVVGPAGSVVGVDRSAAAVRMARRRTMAARTANVEFVQADLADFAASRGFDAVVGRHVLGHQADPVAFLRHAARLVRPGGVVAFHEADIDTGPRTTPRVPLVHQVWDWVTRALRRTVPNGDAGTRMAALFPAAGLPRPALLIETVSERSRPWVICAWLTELAASLLPVMVQHDIVTEAEVDPGTLEWRLRTEVAVAGSRIELVPQVGAWARLPEASRRPR